MSKFVAVYSGLCAAGLTVFAIYMAIDYLVTGFGVPYGMGFCSGVIFTFALLYVRLLFKMREDRAAAKRNAASSPYGRFERIP